MIFAIESDTNICIQNMKVDGGMAKNDAIMQLQSDIWAKKLIKKEITELTAVGSAIAAGLWQKIKIW